MYGPNDYYRRIDRDAIPRRLPSIEPADFEDPYSDEDDDPPEGWDYDDTPDDNWNPRGGP